MELVAIDLDGTLLDSRQQISQENRAAVRRLVGEGVKVVIATGRSVISVREIIKELGIEAYALALNGTYIAKINQQDQLKTLRRAILKKRTVLTAFNIAEALGVTFIASNEFGSDKVVFRDGQELVQEFISNRPDLRLLEKGAFLQCVKDPATEYLKAAFTSTDVEKLLELRSSLLEAGIPAVFSDQHYIEIVPEGVNKGNALAFICDYLAISLANTAAIGDQENDLEMLQQSGIGAAMGNSNQPIKAAADVVTDTNDQNGVAKFLNTLL